MDDLNRLEILAKIDKLINHSCETDCNCDEEIRKLGELLKKPRKRKAELLAKGSDMKMSEIKELREMEVSWLEIAKATGINKDHLREMGGENMSNLDKAKHLLETTDKTYKEIAEETGIKEGTVGYHGKKIRSNKASVKAVQAVKSLSETKDTQKKEKALQDDLQAKYNRLSEQHAKLTEENNRLHKVKNDLIIELGDLKNKLAIHEYDMKQAENAIDSYKGMLRERNKDCDVLEDELSKLHEAYDRLKAWVQVDIGVMG